MNILDNVNIKHMNEIISPLDLKKKLKLDINTKNNIIKWRSEVSKIINNKDKRKIIIVGPCSIHDEKVALEFANYLVELKKKYNNKIFIIMRVYFEKPRTTIGWKGLINDPDLDKTFKINKGIHLARNILLKINKLGIPCGCEFLDVFTPQYFSDLVTWGAIGARTTESQLHRQLASGLSMPVGFKNGTSGNIDIAINAVISSNYSHTFIGINNDAKASVILTKGNNDSHVILRGGLKPNYYIDDLNILDKKLIEKNIKKKYIIDCSHGNSQKNHKNQIKVLQYILKNNPNNCCGFMIEANIKEGNQKLINKNNLEYGKSITDKCIDIQTLKKIFLFF